MKTRSFIFASLALAALVSCQEVIKPASVSQVSVNPQIVKVSADGDTKTVQLTANCDWETSASAGWVAVAPASGTGDATITITVNANSSDAREATVTITATGASTHADLLVSQSGVAPVTPTPGPDNPTPTPGGNTISNVAQLQSFMAEAGSMTAEDEWTIEADIDCGGASVSPIPSFGGVLDGKNHKIYNYSVVSAEESAGLFLTMTGTVKNIILGSKDGKTWDGTSTVGYVEGAPTGHTGGVVASLNGTLENVKNFATVNATLNNAAVAGIGGLVGTIDSPALVSGCENGGQIAMTVVTMGNGAYAGGIVGHTNNAEALVSKCINSADLEFDVVNTKYLMYGGIVGCMHVNSTVDNCQNLGSVVLNQSAAETSGTYIMIAGIAGAVYTGGVVTNCVNKGAVSSNRMQVSRIGGIVGTLNSKGLIEGNTNDGPVTLKQNAPNDNWQAAGGIVGFEEKESSGNTVRKNTNNGTVTVVVENSTTHANKVSAGGIIGYGVLGLEIEENINTGAVSVTNNGAGPAYAGGIAGWFRGAGSYLKDNQNKGAVTLNTKDTAASAAGGVVGQLVEKTGTATGDKNTGAVTFAVPGRVGSVAGVNDGALSGCGAGGSVNGTALSDSNYATFIQGTASSGTATGSSFAK